MAEITKINAPQIAGTLPERAYAGEHIGVVDCCYIAASGAAFRCRGTNGAVTDRVRGQAVNSAEIGQNILLSQGGLFTYAVGLTTGVDVYLSASVYGGLATTPPYSGATPVGYCYNNYQISFYPPGAIASTSSAPITYSITTANDGATVTFDLSTSVFQTVVLGGNRTLAVTGDVVGRPFTIILKQDATGSRTVTWWSGIRWAGGSAPSLTAMAAKEDTLVFIKRGNGDYMGFVSGLNA